MEVPRLEDAGWHHFARLARLQHTLTVPFVFLAAVAAATPTSCASDDRRPHPWRSELLTGRNPLQSWSRTRLVGIRGWLLLYVDALAVDLAHGLALTIGALVIYAKPSLAGLHSFIPLWALLIYVVSNLGLLAYGVVLFVLMAKGARTAIANNILLHTFSIAFLVIWFFLSAKSPIGTVVDALPDSPRSPTSLARAEFGTHLRTPQRTTTCNDAAVATRRDVHGHSRKRRNGGARHLGLFRRPPPHGDRLRALRRQVPVVTTIVDTPERIREWFAIVDELNDEAGLVTSEMVPALWAVGFPTTLGVACGSPVSVIGQTPLLRKTGAQQAVEGIDWVPSE